MLVHERGRSRKTVGVTQRSGRGAELIALAAAFFLLSLQVCVRAWLCVRSRARADINVGS